MDKGLDVCSSIVYFGELQALCVYVKFVRTGNICICYKFSSDK